MIYRLLLIISLILTCTNCSNLVGLLTKKADNGITATANIGDNKKQYSGKVGNHEIKQDVAHNKGQLAGKNITSTGKSSTVYQNHVPYQIWILIVALIILSISGYILAIMGWFSYPPIKIMKLRNKRKEYLEEKIKNDKR